MTDTKWKAGDWVAVAMEVVREASPDGIFDFMAHPASWMGKGLPVGIQIIDIIGPAKRPICVGDKVQRWFMPSAERLEVVYDGGKQMLTRSEHGDLALMDTDDLRHWPMDAKERE